MRKIYCTRQVSEHTEKASEIRARKYVREYWQYTYGRL